MCPMPRASLCRVQARSPVVFPSTWLPHELISEMLSEFKATSLQCPCLVRKCGKLTVINWSANIRTTEVSLRTTLAPNQPQVLSAHMGPAESAELKMSERTNIGSTGVRLQVVSPVAGVAALWESIWSHVYHFIFWFYFSFHSVIWTLHL